MSIKEPLLLDRDSPENGACDGEVSEEKHRRARRATKTANEERMGPTVTSHVGIYDKHGAFGGERWIRKKFLDYHQKHKDDATSSEDATNVTWSSMVASPFKRSETVHFETIRQRFVTEEKDKLDMKEAIGCKYFSHKLYDYDEKR